MEPYLSPLSVNLIEPGLKATGRITLFPLDKEEVMCGGVGAGVGCWLPRPLLGDGGGAESGDESSEKRVSLPLSMFNTHNLQRF